MAYEFGPEVMDEEARYVRELLGEAILYIELACSKLKDACALGGDMTANDTFRLSGQMLHLKNVTAITRDILKSIEPEDPKPVPSLDEDGEL